MKKIIVLAIVAMMVMVFAASANAYLFRVQTATSGQGQISNTASSSLDLGPVVGPEARYGLYVNNVVTAGNPTLLTLKMTTNADNTWYGKVWGVSGYEGKADLRFFAASATNTSILPAGKWYIYSGIGQVVADPSKAEGKAIDGATKVAEGTFTASQTTWAASTLGYAFNLGDQWTLSTYDAKVVPEPGSILALASGLVGLVGFSIRRRK